MYTALCNVILTDIIHGKISVVVPFSRLDLSSDLHQILPTLSHIDMYRKSYKVYFIVKEWQFELRA